MYCRILLGRHPSHIPKNVMVTIPSWRPPFGRIPSSLKRTASLPLKMVVKPIIGISELPCGLFFRCYVMLVSGRMVVSIIFFQTTRSSSQLSQKTKKPTSQHLKIHLFLTGQFFMKSICCINVPPKKKMAIWVVVSNICCFHPYLGKIPILANISTSKGTTWCFFPMNIVRFVSTRILCDHINLSTPAWMSRWKVGLMVRINWLFHLLLNGVYWDCNYNPLILIIY